ncbi:MAG: hypothetical protein LBQ34_06395 [Alphaproteobacteria bacterium]|jgi:hypothetical protein|nr:hypothetical protein [Alphaproteobacteria bacterium]
MLKVNINTINNTTKTYKINLSAEELLSLAKETDVVSFTSLSGEINISRNMNRFMVLGEVIAEFAQEDAMTLEEITTRLVLPIKRIYQKEAKLEKAKDIKKVIMSFDKEEEEIDTLENDTIDLDFIILEELILNIDPFAKKE